MARQYVLGVEELEKKLKRMGEKLSHRVLAKAIKRSMVPIRNEARARAPVAEKYLTHRTHKGRLVARGFLKTQVKLKKQKTRDKRFAGYMLSARDEGFYGGLIETGFRGVKGRPWLGPVWHRNKEEAKNRMLKELAKELKKARK